MRLALVCGAVCAIGCGHIYPIGTTSPVQDCVALVNAGRHHPAHLYVAGQLVDHSRLDAVVSADPMARDYADQGARVAAGAFALMGAGLTVGMGGSVALVVAGGNERYAGVGIIGAGLALELTGAVMLALDRNGKRALERINQRARAVGRCPPGL
jgi:hypothetical protein